MPLKSRSIAIVINPFRLDQGARASCGESAAADRTIRPVRPRLHNPPSTGLKARVEEPADGYHFRFGRARLLPSRRVEHAVAAHPKALILGGFCNTPLKARGTWCRVPEVR